MNRVGWTVAGLAWTTAALAAYVFRGELMENSAGKVMIAVLCIPPVIALYALAHVLVEGATYILLWVPFKLVTLGLVRTELTEPGVVLPWYGIARAKNGVWVASEDAMALIALAVYALAGAAIWYFLVA